MLLSIVKLILYYKYDYESGIKILGGVERI